MLVVGDGDLSFSAAVARLRAKAAGTSARERQALTCTVFDSQSEVAAKYGEPAKAYIKELSTSRQARVSFNVDATRLRESLPAAKDGERWNVIAFNFPHTGSQRVHENRAMLGAFFESARPLLVPGGRVDVTMNEGRPYVDWGLEELAEKASLALVRAEFFDFGEFPGYTHQTTLRGAATPGARDNCKTYSFMPV